MDTIKPPAEHAEYSESLPEGYEFADPQTITIDEVLDIRASVGWETSDEDKEQISSDLSKSVAVVGVRDGKGELIGVGFLAGNNRHAILCDLTVDTEHQNLGIGSAISKRQIQLADQMHIKYLYVDRAESNNLAVYSELGFVKADRVLSRKRPDSN